MLVFADPSRPHLLSVQGKQCSTVQKAHWQRTFSQTVSVTISQSHDKKLMTGFASLDGMINLFNCMFYIVGQWQLRWQGRVLEREQPQQITLNQQLKNWWDLNRLSHGTSFGGRPQGRYQRGKMSHLAH